MKVNIEKALDFLLFEEYCKEFEVIDRLNQHPDGLNFYEWLYKHQIISKEDMEIKLLELKEAED